MTHFLEGKICISLTNPLTVLSVSDGIEALLGFKADDFLTGKVSLLMLIHADDLDIADDLFSTEINHASGSFNIRLRQANGCIRCFRGQYTKVPDATGNEIILDLQLQDAKSLRQNLSDQPMMRNFKAMMENTDDYIYFKDRNHVFTGASQTLVSITEPSVHWTDLLGQTDYDVFPEEYADKYYLLEKQVFAGIQVAHEIQETLDKDGNKGWVDNRKYPIHDENNVIIGLFGIARDITVRKQIEEQVYELAFYDPLTNLPNRRLLQERLKHGIDVQRREGKQLAVLMLDLDHFKAVNDSFGHQSGDELLRQVAERITTRLRHVDMVARLGGDEFIVLLEDIAHPDDAARVAEEIIADISKPFKFPQGSDVQIGVSIGISLYPQHGDSPEILLDHADAAQYHAKDQGRGCFAYFSEELTIVVRERIALEVRLRKAIKQQELRVFYQPQMDIVSDRIIGAEALVRWQDPIKGLIPPFYFIPIAEETNLIVEIGGWVLRETCRQGRQWLDAGLPPLTLAVNVSSHQFHRSDICALVATVLAETGFPANQLELEITESGLMKIRDNATAILNSLRAQGVRLAIDDFGTGYSSLAYLKHFPLDTLKIDKSFIDEISHNQDDMEIAATIVAIGHTLGFKVMAEGVEMPEQLAFLRKNGCDTYQGFIKSRPIPAEEFAELLRDQQRGE